MGELKLIVEKVPVIGNPVPRGRKKVPPPLIVVAKNSSSYISIPAVLAS